MESANLMNKEALALDTPVRTVNVQPVQSSHPLKHSQKQLSQIPEFVNPSTKVEWMSDYIHPGQYVACVPAQIYGFGSFYVNALEHWNALTRFMEILHKWYTSEPTCSEAEADTQCLSIGLCVAVLCQIGDMEKEYHRAKILSIDGTQRKAYKIFLIDFGDIFNACLEDIKYLKREFLENFPAQAIHCNFLWNPSYGGNAQHQQQWSLRMQNALKQKIFQRVLGVEFLQKADEVTEDKGGIQWLVSINLITQQGRILQKGIEQTLEKVDTLEHRPFASDEAN